jgi:hypothetical protein
MNSSEDSYSPEIQIESLTQEIEKHVANDRKRAFLSSLILITIGVIFLCFSIWKSSELTANISVLEDTKKRLEDDVEKLTRQKKDLIAERARTDQILGEAKQQSQYGVSETDPQKIRQEFLALNNTLSQEKNQISLIENNQDLILQSYAVTIYYQEGIPISEKNAQRVKSAIEKNTQVAALSVRSITRERMKFFDVRANEIRFDPKTEKMAAELLQKSIAKTESSIQIKLVKTQNSPTPNFLSIFIAPPK